METSEAALNDKGLTHISRVWPIIDAPNDAVTVTIGQRNKLGDPVTWRTPTQLTSTTGSAPVRSTAMYQRARIEVAAGASWTHSQGVEPDARPAGNR
jgi:hypothetical protein